MLGVREMHLHVLASPSFPSCSLSRWSPARWPARRYVQVELQRSLSLPRWRIFSRFIVKEDDGWEWMEEGEGTTGEWEGRGGGLPLKPIPLPMERHRTHLGV